MAEATIPTEELEYAGSMLEHHEIVDASQPGLLELMGVSQAGTPTASGKGELDYQPLSSLSMGLKELHQLSTVNKMPIPPEIMEHFNHVQSHCMMGLFAEIGRAWLTIDTEIYIWTYENARDVAYFDGLDKVIISVGLVTPRPGVFKPEVKYLLVLTTPYEIVVLGVMFNEIITGTPNRTGSGRTVNVGEEMQLMSSPIFVLSTDNVGIMCVHGTDDGRIFLGGCDGCLYEICYQAESNWFKKQCRKVNHSQGLISNLVPGIFKFFSDKDSVDKIAIDNSRHLLYVLMTKGTIEAWDIGPEAGGGVRRLARLTFKDIITSAQMVLRSDDSSIYEPITAICALTVTDSSCLHLVAVSKNGIRFYFSTVSLYNQASYMRQQQLSYQQRQHQQQMQQLQQLQQLQQPQQPHQHDLAPMPPVNYFDHEPSDRPQGLYLMHVRLPQTVGASVRPNAAKKSVHAAHSIGGALFMVTSPQQDQDALWMVNSEPFQTQAHFIESESTLPLDGQVLAIANVKQHDRVSIETPLRMAQIPRKVALLTNQGVHTVSVLRAVDILQQLLLTCRGPHNDAVKAYFEIQTEAEACASAVLLACLESFRGTELGDWATQAFVLYGGEPYYETYHSGSGAIAGGPSGGGMVGPAITQRPLAFGSSTGGAGYGMDPLATPQSAMVGGRMYMSTPYTSGFVPTSVNTSFNNNNLLPTDAPTLRYSAKHAGLYLHVCRVLRCVWRRKCTDERLHSTIALLDLGVVLEDLFAIRSFFESVGTIRGALAGFTGGRNTLASSTVIGHGPHSNQAAGLLLQSPALGSAGGYGGGLVMPQPYGGTGAGPVVQQHTTEEASREEKRSLDALARLIKQACEVIGLWKVICEHQCHLLLGQLLPEQQAAIKACTFRDLIVARPGVCGLLIVTLINSYLADSASIGSISSKLREVCPTLYRHEDAVSHKATEVLLQTRDWTDRERKEERLQMALQLCKSAAPNLPLDTLCQKFTAAGFYTGVIELCSVCAAKKDPNETALHFYQNDNPEGFVAYQNRMQCYNEVKRMLDVVYETNEAGPASGTEATRYPEPHQGAEDTRALAGGGTKFQTVLAIITQALQNTDQLLHVAIYEWLLAQKLHSELLEIAEPSLGVFLSRSMAHAPDSLLLADLLWKYHERNGQHTQAAQILDKLAHFQGGDGLDLGKRIEYLARAVMCMRSEAVGFSAHNGVLLKELEDKLEVAQIQRQVSDALTMLLARASDPAVGSVRDALQQLNGSLFNLTQLYSEFAEPYDLWECKLKILNCSHHNDPLLIESVWSHILDRELEVRDGAAERCRRMLAKVKSLALEYDSAGHCFPLAFIVRELEVRCFRSGLFNSPVPEALFEMNLDVDDLLNIYSRLVSMNERIWVTEDDELYLIRSTAALLALIVAQPKQIPLKERRKVMAKSQDLISAALNILYTKPDTQALIELLRDTQTKLQRVV
ncbi:nuclear pore complex protein Nup154 [Anopheles bellator]|uniref:nuclear pore complex protein Nup154 n=1 Tax=Anopheles bellator TaxID=139047 RepID=UPI002647624A|nr:nuclear pore complex protein Nup154 [Anopheles bellator]